MSEECSGGDAADQDHPSAAVVTATLANPSHLVQRHSIAPTESPTIHMITEPALPDWVQSIRPHQEQAVDEAVELFETNQVVFVDGPTGSGKTLIAELVRRRLDARRTLYVCSDKSLQDQFARDFPYAKVLKGRANYPTQSNPHATAADCTAKSWDDMCFHCEDGKAGCPYEIAKHEALMSPLTVTNISYLLSEANYVGKMSGFDLVIVDEADVLEQVLMGFVEYRVPKMYMQMCKMDPPIKGARKKTLIAWLKDFHETFKPLVHAELDLKRKRTMETTLNGAVRVIGELERELRMREDNDEEGVWLRDYEKDDTFILKTVTVSGYGHKYLWRHAQKWLVMSATLISSDEMADSTGLVYDYDTVHVPMTFPVENRRVIMAPVANMSYKEMNEGTAIDDSAYAIQTIIRQHPDDRILIHTVSYQLSQRLHYLLTRGAYKVPNRSILTYDTGRGRESALAQFKQTKGAVLLAPSMERGIDLPDDLCRVQVIAKVPFPSLANRQVSTRANMGNAGRTWYAVQTIRDIVQMCGRGVRHKRDWCTTYILDRQFAKNLYAKNKSLFPEWFKEAVDTRTDIRYLKRPQSNQSGS